MVTVFRYVYACAAFLSMTAGVLVTASLFIADRAPQSITFLVFSLVVIAVFLGTGLVLFGIQRHVAALAAAVRGKERGSLERPAMHLDRLVGYLLAGGAFVCALLVILNYAILARIDQGFAVFG
jgi:hypothetical protein